jgi:hypothetical protein
MKNELQDPSNWISVMRGISIRAPVSWDIGTSAIKATDQVDFIGLLSSLQYADIKDVYSTAMQNAHRADGRIVITTVSNNENLCNFIF